MDEIRFTAIFFLIIILIAWVIISRFFKISFFAKKDDTPHGYYKKMKERKEKLIEKLNKTLEEIDREKGDYRGDWNMVETWKKQARLSLTAYSSNEMLDEVYEILNELLEAGLRDVKEGKNPYDSDYLRLKDLKHLEKSKTDKKVREL